MLATVSTIRGKENVQQAVNQKDLESYLDILSLRMKVLSAQIDSTELFEVAQALDNRQLMLLPVPSPAENLRTVHQIESMVRGSEALRLQPSAIASFICLFQKFSCGTHNPR